MIPIALRKTSLVDYPGRVAAVLFLQGCNLRCPWCHNRELVLAAPGDIPLSLEEGLAHLEKRRSVLGGAVISGGEPTVYQELPALIRRIKALGLPVKLDTNGLAPAMLETLLRQEDSRPDYIALDLKLAPARYRELAPLGEDSAEALGRSAALIRDSGVACEYRTLVLPGGFITAADIEALAPLAEGGPWYFRPFRPGNCLDPAWDALEEPGPGETRDLARCARSLGKVTVTPCQSPPSPL